MICYHVVTFDIDLLQVWTITFGYTTLWQLPSYYNIYTLLYAAASYVIVYDYEYSYSSPMINVAMLKLNNYNHISHVIQIVWITFSMGHNIMDVQISKSLGSVTIILLI